MRMKPHQKKVRLEGKEKTLESRKSLHQNLSQELKTFPVTAPSS